NAGALARTHVRVGHISSGGDRKHGCELAADVCPAHRKQRSRPRRGLFIVVLGGISFISRRLLFYPSSRPAVSRFLDCDRGRSFLCSPAGVGDRHGPAQCCDVSSWLLARAHLPSCARRIFRTYTPHRRFPVDSVYCWLWRLCTTVDCG